MGDKFVHNFTKEICVLGYQMICAPPRVLPRASLRRVLPHTALCSRTKHLQNAIWPCCNTQNHSAPRSIELLQRASYSALGHVM